VNTPKGRARLLSSRFSREIRGSAGASPSRVRRILHRKYPELVLESRAKPTPHHRMASLPGFRSKLKRAATERASVAPCTGHQGRRTKDKSPSEPASACFSMTVDRDFESRAGVSIRPRFRDFRLRSNPEITTPNTKHQTPNTERRKMPAGRPMGSIFTADQTSRGQPHGEKIRRVMFQTSALLVSSTGYCTLSIHRPTARWQRHGVFCPRRTNP